MERSCHVQAKEIAPSRGAMLRCHGFVTAFSLTSFHCVLCRSGDASSSSSDQSTSSFVGCGSETPHPIVLDRRVHSRYF